MTQLTQDVSKVVAKVDGAQGGGCQPPAPKLSPNDRLLKETFETLQAGGYVNLLRLCLSNRERLLKAGTLAKSSVKMNGFEFQQETSLDHAGRRGENQVDLYAQGWNFLMQFLSRKVTMDPPEFSAAHLADLLAFWWKAWEVHATPESKVALIDKFFMDHGKQIGQWESMLQTCSWTVADVVVRSGPTACRSAVVLPSPTIHQLTASRGGPSVGKQPAGLRGGGPATTQTPSQSARKVLPDIPFFCMKNVFPDGKCPGPTCKCRHDCPSCGAQHTAKECQAAGTWDAAAVQVARDAVVAKRTAAGYVMGKRNGKRGG